MPWNLKWRQCSEIVLRDLSSVLQQQSMDTVADGEGDVDVIAVAQMEGVVCVNLQ